MAKPEIPKTMRALQIDAYHEDLPQAIRSLKLIEKPVPEPGPGQVLIRIEAAACNPSDLIFLTGKYNMQKTLPAIPGFEACGTVVRSGGGLLGWLRMGNRVACGGQEDRDGTWAEYFVAEARSCLPLRADIPADQGAAMIVNPLTAVALVDLAARRKSPAIVQAAAASQLGRMIITLARKAGIESINIVRRTEQVELLRQAGAKYILNSSDPDHQEQLAELCQRLTATTAFDPLSGTSTGSLLEALAPGGQVIVYGTLAGSESLGIRARALSGQRKSVVGFHLKNWLAERGIIVALRQYNRMQKLIASGEIHTEILKEVSLADAAAAMQEYAENMTLGKVILRPSN